MDQISNYFHLDLYDITFDSVLGFCLFIQTALSILWEEEDFRHDKVTGSWGGSPQGSQHHHR